MDNNDNFFNQLDELIELFKRLHDKAIKEGMFIKDDPMYQNFELLMGNYKLIRNTIPPEMVKEMGEPLKQMITEMVNQLKNDLDIRDDLMSSSVEKQAEPDSGNDSDYSVTDKIAEIDEILKSGKLSEKEINALLDKRARLTDELQ